MKEDINKPTVAFIAASWNTLIIGAIAYGIGLYEHHP